MDCIFKSNSLNIIKKQLAKKHCIHIEIFKLWI
jgi:hypothetical protein